MRFHRSLLLVAALLSICVVAFGSYVRLSDAGLGCPDWPGCYGHFVSLPDTPDEQAAAALQHPGRPVEAAKAWKEMTHRYLAGTLGLLIFASTVVAWRRRVAFGASGLLAALVVVQATLGMWTVTLLLKPAIVTGHLLGGMAILGLLVWLVLGQSQDRLGTPSAYGGLRLLARVTLLALALQIALGGWVSSNYAALACTEFPACSGGAWLPPMDFARAFTLRRELGYTGDGQLLPAAALTAIHWTHRMGAAAVLLIAGSLALRLIRVPGLHRLGLTLALLLALQVSLGIGNVLLSLPLPLAVAHNLGAALLVTALVAINARVRR